MSNCAPLLQLLVLTLEPFIYSFSDLKIKEKMAIQGRNPCHISKEQATLQTTGLFCFGLVERDGS